MTADPDDALAADGRLPLDHDLGIDRRVRIDRDGVLDVRAGRIENRDAALHQPVEDPPALDGRHRGELLAVVHAGRLAGIRRHDRVDARAGAGEDADHVRQVVLALVVVGAHLAERLPEPRGREAVHRGVDLGDLLLGGGRVPVFDDPLDAPALAHDASVALRGGDDGGQHRRGGAALPVVVDQAADRLDGQERHVPREDEDGSVTALGLSLLDGVSAPEPLALDHRPHVGSGQRHDLVGVRSHDQDDPIGQGSGGTKWVRDQGATAEGVEHFGLPRAHALAFASSENDSGHLAHRV